MLLLIKSVEIQNCAIEFNNWLVNASDNFYFPVFQEQLETFTEKIYFRSETLSLPVSFRSLKCLSKSDILAVWWFLTGQYF